jgi:hypothetical protein
MLRPWADFLFYRTEITVYLRAILLEDSDAVMTGKGSSKHRALSAIPGVVKFCWCQGKVCMPKAVGPASFDCQLLELTLPWGTHP